MHIIGIITQKREKIYYLIYLIKHLKKYNIQSVAKGRKFMVIIKKNELDLINKQINELFNFYQNQIRPLVAELGTQELTGYHGLTTHTDAVVFRGIDYALNMQESALPVVFACACHDMARTDDAFNLNHGPDAVPMAKTIIEKYKHMLNNDNIESILYAIANHTNGVHAPDYISACLWDADRTRLSWEYGFDPAFYNTERGQKVASEQAKNYLEYQKKCIPNHIWLETY